MAIQVLNEHFSRFFNLINPSQTWVSRASSQYNSIKQVVEGAGGKAAKLKPKIFQQGSYGRNTAIYTINDLDIVALCQGLSFPGGGSGTGWSRDQIFDAIAEPLLNDGRYKEKVFYSSSSMCLKIDLGIKVEILPVVMNAGNSSPIHEPFYLYRPEAGRWEKGFAQDHQLHLSKKNNRTNGNFIPMIKVLKHIRSRFGNDAVSFHIECLLYSIPDHCFSGSPADCIASVVSFISQQNSWFWQNSAIETPCGDRKLFDENEWGDEKWQNFHALITQICPLLLEAVTTMNRDRAIECWQAVLGDYFPAYR